ncbi:MAG: RsiV family protein [Lachnospiraceae bacterium]|nr:RsiV family protein [Lachnospiraceae bacterium]
MKQKELDLKKIENAKKQYEVIKMSEAQIEAMKNRIDEAKKEKRKRNKGHAIRNIAAAAAAVAVFVALPNTSPTIAYAMSNIPVLGKLVEVVTFRDYQYESERNNADIKVPELVVENTEQTIDGDQESGKADGQIQENLKKTTEEINAEIQEITEQIAAEFEENLQYEEGYQDVLVKSEIIATTDDYFTLKLVCYRGAGSGAEWDYFYTIDLTTGNRLALKDLFVEGADYITPISENIKEQMREQMKADEMVYYWVDDEIEEWNFKAITDETSFYLNEQNEIVVAFDEYEVAPGYMGCVEFVIPNEVTAAIRKMGK